MNETMNAKTIDWDNWRLFLAVAREQGLAGAARVTGKSAATIGRRMLSLERETGRELFYRLPRGYELTDDGQTIFKKMVQLESEMLAIGDPKENEVHELVKVSAGSWMTYGLCKNIKQVMKTANDVRVRFLSSEATLDISRRETTIGIRNSRPSQENLVCRKIARIQFAGYAVNKDVKNWILVHQDTPSAQWLRSKKGNTALIEVNSPRNALDLIETGVGCAVLPTFIGDSLNSLVRVTPKIGELSHDQWLVTHPDEQFHPSVRKVIDGIYLAAKYLHKN